MKKILLLIFFTCFFRVAAQEDPFEISLGLGPSYTNNSPKAGLGVSGKLGYKMNNVLTVFVGADFISFPLTDEKVVFHPRVDSLNIGRVNSVEMQDGRGLFSLFLVGGRVNILSQQLFSPFLTANIGFFFREENTNVYRIL